MKRLGNLFQIAYLFFAGLFLYQAITIWGTDRSRAYLYLAIVVVALFKFFFNRKYRKRFEDHYKNRENNKKGSN